MSNTYTVKVNNQYEFNVDTSDLDNDAIVALGKTEYHLLYNNKSSLAEIIDTDFVNKSYKVKVNSKTYKININNELDNLIKSMGFELGVNKQVNEVKAPMPGLLLDIQVEVGQEVAEDDPLLILEAMKMENVITSPRSGTIKSIKVNKGDAVDKNQLLIEFEA